MNMRPNVGKGPSAGTGFCVNFHTISAYATNHVTGTDTIVNHSIGCAVRLDGVGYVRIRV